MVSASTAKAYPCVVRALRIPAALAVIAGLVVLTAWIMAWPVERAVYLAPVIVVGVAAVLGLIILWGRIALESLRETRRPKLVLGLWLAGIGLLVLLSARRRAAARGLTPRSSGEAPSAHADNPGTAAGSFRR